MCEDNWTEKETERQDIVDNAIQNLMVELAPWGVDDVEWDIEYIGEVRDTIKEFLVDKLHLMTEQQFYPYRDVEPEPDENIILEPSKSPTFFILDEEKIIAQMYNFLDEIDADELARLTGEFFGGECYFIKGEYHFYPDENYNDAFGPLELLGEEK